MRELRAEMSVVKQNMLIISDHTIKFDDHINFVEQKFDWYKNTLDYLRYVVSFKFLTSQQGYPEITD